MSSMKATTPGIPCRICSIVRWNSAGADEMPKRKTAIAIEPFVSGDCEQVLGLLFLLHLVVGLCEVKFLRTLPLLLEGQTGRCRAWDAGVGPHLILG